MGRIGILDRVRQPQYTGKNRCTPCTVVNSFLAVVAAVAIGAATAPLGSGTTALLAGGALAAFASVIYLCGYLVPGTPWVTEAYFPDWILRRFEHRNGRSADTHVADEETANTPSGDTWESHAALLADTAAADVLQRRYGMWPSIGVKPRGQVLSGLRLFLERCPSCDGPVTADQSIVESCCRSLDVLAVTCQECGARVFEIEEAR